MRPKVIGIVGHTGKPGVPDLLRGLLEELRQRWLEVLVEARTAALISAESTLTVAELAVRSDLLVVAGGDGTILNVVSQLNDVMKPIFGINIGSLGFLTCLSSAAYRDAAEAIAMGRINYSDRALLVAEVKTDAGTVVRLTGLNDAVISRGEVSRLIRLKTRVNGEALTEFNADGLIVATPTGSTAYSLSAGGPILSPGSGVFVITPICPHVLTNRSIIVEENAIVEVEVSQREYPVYLTVDGGEPVKVEPGATVVIRKADKMLPLAALPEVSFFSVVRQKLKWSGSNV